MEEWSAAAPLTVLFFTLILFGGVISLLGKVDNGQSNGTPAVVSSNGNCARWLPAHGFGWKKFQARVRR